MFPHLLSGPSTDFLVGWGAKLGACMRKDTKLFAAYAKQDTEELQMGCCVTPTLDCGITTAGNCTGGNTFSGPGSRCDVQTCNPLLRPCCKALTGHCEIVSQGEAKSRLKV